jgi:hypothetical protein
MNTIKRLENLKKIHKEAMKIGKLDFENSATVKFMPEHLGNDYYKKEKTIYKRLGYAEGWNKGVDKWLEQYKKNQR